MIMKYLFINYLVIITVFVNQSSGQTTNALNNQNDVHYTNLRTQIKEQPESALKLQIAQLSLDKAKNELDTLGMANAYYFLSRLDLQHTLTYADSLIAITRNKNYKRYPALGYLQKGNNAYEKGDYQRALELYLSASKFAKQNNNEYLYRTLKFNIGLLKNAAGEREEAQIIFIEHLNFLDENLKYKKIITYNKVLFAIADSYIHSKELDKAEAYINKGIEQTIKTNDTSTYSYIVVTSGVHQYFSKNYKKAIDSLAKGKRLILKRDESQIRVATCDYYTALSYHSLGNEDLSIEYFKNVDRILKQEKDIIPELIPTYDYLIAHAKSNNDVEQQLEYINTLLKLDSIRHSDEIYLTKNINEKYDTVELLSEKEKLINALEEETFLKEGTITKLISFLIILLALATYGFWRSYINKKRFEALLKKQKNKEKTPPEFTAIIPEMNSKEEIDIAEDVVEGVLKKLHAFENSDKYSKKYYTLNSLAKELHTNSAYLSKIINVYKNVNFANYLNNLRIDFAVDRLTSDKSLHSYTIKAIAEEVGFKNAQSFSSAFQKKTGIYPSYFIKKLNG